jgi:hypothetical protein
MSEKELIEIRAALIQLAKALETERACVLRIVKAIERVEAEGGEIVPVAIAINTEVSV